MTDRSFDTYFEDIRQLSHAIEALGADDDAVDAIVTQRQRLFGECIDKPADDLATIKRKLRLIIDDGDTGLVETRWLVRIYHDLARLEAG